MYISLSIIIAEILLITYLNFVLVGTHISLDVLYCLPIIQAARTKALQAQRKSDSRLPILIGFLAAFAWSFSEKWVSPEDFPVAILALNIFTRTVTLGLIGRLVSRLWVEREYGQKDFLTDLTNRAEWIDKFEYEQSRSERSGRPYSLLYIDIDRFKQLNDSQGHSVGDEALKQVAHILKKGSRKMDTLARIGGDEFVVLFPETDANSCEILMNRILETADLEFKQCGWDISLSIGNITQTGKSKSAHEILDEVDSIMYATKKSKGIQ